VKVYVVSLPTELQVPLQVPSLFNVSPEGADPDIIEKLTVPVLVVAVTGGIVVYALAASLIVSDADEDVILTVCEIPELKPSARAAIEAEVITVGIFTP
jgi:hypothetical protein